MIVDDLPLTMAIVDLVELIVKLIKVFFVIFDAVLIHHSVVFINIVCLPN